MSHQTNTSDTTQQGGASSYTRRLAALQFNRTKLLQREWAIEQALRQRYSLIVDELERRKVYYQQLEQIEYIRLIITTLTVFLLLLALIWTYKFNQQQQEERSKDKKRGKQKGFFLLGWAPGDLYFQDQQTSSQEFNNCYSDDEEDDLSTLIKYQNHGQFYEPGEFLDDPDDQPLRNRIAKSIYNLITLRFMSSSKRNEKQFKYTQMKQQPRPDFVRPQRDLSQMNVITHHQQVINAKQNAAKAGSIQLSSKDTNATSNQKEQVQLLRM